MKTSVENEDALNLKRAYELPNWETTKQSS